MKFGLIGTILGAVIPLFWVDYCNFFYNWKISYRNLKMTMKEMRCGMALIYLIGFLPCLKNIPNGKRNLKINLM